MNDCSPPGKIYINQLIAHFLCTLSFVLLLPSSTSANYCLYTFLEHSMELEARVYYSSLLLSLILLPHRGTVYSKSSLSLTKRDFP